jgi:hypothetical protein
MKKVINNKMAKSWLKVFGSTVLALFLADGGDVVGVGWGDLRTYLAAGIASILPLVITWLDPSDARFGKIASTDSETSND